MEQSYIMMQPHEKMTVSISLDTICPEKVNEHLELLVNDGGSQYLNVLAEIQRPHVALNRSCMNLGRIYAGVCEYVNPQSKHQKSSITLTNYGNLPASFRWVNKRDPERIIANVEPASGVI